MFYSFRCPAKSRHVCGNSTGLNSASIPWHSRGGRCPLFCRGLVVGIAQNCWEIGGRGRFYDRREYVNVEITHRGYLYLLVYPEMSMCPNPYFEPWVCHCSICVTFKRLKLERSTSNRCAKPAFSSTFLSVANIWNCWWNIVTLTATGTLTT